MFSLLTTVRVLPRHYRKAKTDIVDGNQFRVANCSETFHSF